MNRHQARSFAKQFNQSFSPPFLPDGFVKCSTFEHDDGRTDVIFDIGDRNVAFEAKHMSWYAQDTKFPSDWLIERVKEEAA